MNYYLLIGGNLGDRKMYLTQALEKINAEIGQVKQVSSLYETAAWGYTDQPAFLNQALCLESSYEPLEVLQKMQGIEKALGRERHQRWYARTIDIDMLFCEQKQIQTPELQIPHPHLAERRFVLVPLAEIAPDFLHPVRQCSIQDLLEKCPDFLAVERI